MAMLFAIPNLKIRASYIARLKLTPPPPPPPPHAIISSSLTFREVFRIIRTRFGEHVSGHRPIFVFFWFVLFLIRMFLFLNQIQLVRLVGHSLHSCIHITACHVHVFCSAECCESIA